MILHLFSRKSFVLIALCLMGSVPSILVGKKKFGWEMTQANKAKKKKKYASADKAESITAVKKDKSSGRLEDMDYQELKENKIRHVAAKNHTVAIKYLELMIPGCTDLNELQDIMLELADIYLEVKEYDKAAKLFLEFTKLYPGSDKVEYAYFKCVDCNFKQLSDCDRDQSKTYETIELAEKFMERADIFTNHQADVKAMYLHCQELLLASDMSVVSFYTNRGSYMAAQKRIDLMRQAYLPVIPKSELTLINLEYTLALEQNLPDMIEKKKLELTQKFPDEAESIIKKPETRSVAHRF